MWWNAWKQLWEPAWLERLGWAPLPGPHWSTSDCQGKQGGGDWGTWATRVSSRRQRGRGIGVWEEGGTTRWEGSILQPSLPSEAFPPHACVITPHPAPPHSHETSHNTWYPQVEHHRGAFAMIGLQGLRARLEWLPFKSGHPHQSKTHNTETDHLFWKERAVYSWKANCCF